MTWHLHADPAMWPAGISSLFLQALHPRAAAAIVQNSRFREDPLGRLSRTAAFVSLATYGAPDEIGDGARRVRRIHRALTGQDRRTGETFPVDDPELLLWVHCAETLSYLAVVTRAGYPMTDARADRYLREQRETAALVGLDPNDVPGSRAEYGSYMNEIRTSLSGGPDADVIYEFLHEPPLHGPLAAFVGVYRAGFGHLSYSLLPSWARQLYGRPAYSRRHATVQLRLFRTASFAVPARVRWAIPATAGHVLEAMAEHGRVARPSPRKMP